MDHAIDKQEMKHPASSFNEDLEKTNLIRSSLGSALGSVPFQLGGGGSGKVGILSSSCEPAMLRGPGRGAGTTALGSEVCHLTSLAMKVKELVTTDGFSRVFCLQMAF